MPIYSSPNAYTPLVVSRIYDADTILASVDNILKTPPRTRLFHPLGFDPEQWLFSMDEADLPFKILNDVYENLQQDPRLTLLYSAKDVVNDYAHETISLNLRIKIQGFDDKNFQRKLTISRMPSQ